MQRIFLILFFLGLANIQAQEKSEITDYVILMSDTDMLEATIDVGRSDFRNGHFRIVFYGPVLSRLKSEELQTFWDYALKYKIELAACKISMDKLKLTAKDLPERFEIVPNAFTHALELQQKGYKVLRL